MTTPIRIIPKGTGLPVYTQGEFQWDLVERINETRNSPESYFP